MFDEVKPLLRNLPPKTLNAMRQAIEACSDKLGLPPDWVQRWIAFTIIIDALTRATVDGPSPFELKGGAAIELRLRRPDGTLQPRATKDLDATFHGDLGAIEAAVRAALTGDTSRILHTEFTCRVEMEERPGPARRFYVHTNYRGKSFARVKLEVSPYEGTRLPPEQVPAYRLGCFGLDAAETFPCIPLRKQLAQKIHAVTNPIEHNDRFRDLLDINLLSALEPASPELRAVCVETFGLRQTHPWPPTVVARETWIVPLVARAAAMGLERRTVEELVTHAHDYVSAIDGAVGDNRAA